MAVKGVSQAQKFAVRALFVAGVFAHVANQEIEKAIVVVIEENRAGGMSAKRQARFLGDVREMPVAVSFEKCVAAQDRRDVEILGSLIIDVRERRGDIDAIAQPNARFIGDVFEFS